MKPIVSPMEVILALTTEEYEEDEGRRRAFYGKPSVYANTLLELQAELAEAVQEKEKQLVAQEAQTTKDHPTSHSLVTVDPQTALITPNYQDIIGDSLARFQERDYKGLRPEVGETPVQATIEKGKHGIARGYTDGEGVK
ncbi:hypothetical protein ADEAN_000304800 [Angomonas deanei]|uniref:Uncharacterized protein n=1 Tax=Angomonas deanei TaxID=59799 RepID=A0A7G2CA10_9TRYP|nr:hypothetical protein ADEAN_000304800 [Angomonas deanei]